MGGGSSRSTTSNTYPPEFRPAARGAVNQIIAMQGANPLEQYASPYPAGVADLAPMTRGALGMTPLLTLTPESMRELAMLSGVFAETGAGLNDLAAGRGPSRQVPAWQPSTARGRAAMGSGPSSRVAPRPQAAAAPGGPPRQFGSAPETILPGVTSDQIMQAMSSLYGLPGPMYFNRETGTLGGTAPQGPPVLPGGMVQPPAWWTQPPPWWAEGPPAAPVTEPQGGFP